jgi:hypothetical protein
MHIHLKELHPSGRQTYREFSELFYHPHAQKIARRLCRSCTHCISERERSERVRRVPKIRALKPPKPREGLSLDIVFLPKSKNGNSYGLLVVDLFTLYVNFYPMKDNSSRSVVQCLIKYFALHGAPKSVYSEDCHSFRSSVNDLLAKNNITHVLSNEYRKGRLSKIESEVITLRNAYRTTILQSKFFQGHRWNEIFPMVLCKLNAAIAKFGINRESMHYGQLVESSLPLMSDIEIFGPLEEEFNQVCKRFRDKIGRFMGKKKREKRIEERRKQRTMIFMHEVVMREVFLDTEDGRSLRTYTGPYRVVSTCSHGVELRDLKSGDTCSVTYKHVRKLEWDELCTLLPQHSEAMDVLGIMEDRREESKNETSEMAEHGSKEERSQYMPHRVGTLKPGRLYAVAIERIPSRLRHCVQKASWRKDKLARQKASQPGLPSLVRIFDDDEPLCKLVDQEWNKEQEIYKMYDEEGKRCYSFDIDEVEKGKGRKDYKGKKFVSSFQSEETGTLRLRLKREVDRGKGNMTVDFSEITIYFY